MRCFLATTPAPLSNTGAQHKCTTSYAQTVASSAICKNSQKDCRTYLTVMADESLCHIQFNILFYGLQLNSWWSLLLMAQKGGTIINWHWVNVGSLIPHYCEYNFLSILSLNDCVTVWSLFVTVCIYCARNGACRLALAINASLGSCCILCPIIIKNK